MSAQTRRWDERAVAIVEMLADESIPITVAHEPDVGGLAFSANVANRLDHPDVNKLDRYVVVLEDNHNEYSVEAFPTRRALRAGLAAHYEESVVTVYDLDERHILRPWWHVRVTIPTPRRRGPR